MSKSATHVFIVGVGNYDHADALRAHDPKLENFHSLDGPALAAWKLYDFFRNPPPGFALTPELGQIYLHLSPTDVDRQADPQLNAWCESEDFKNAEWTTVEGSIVQWRNALAENENNVAIFCYSGHGYWSSSGPLALLQDFGSNDVKNLRPSSAESRLAASCRTCCVHQRLCRMRI